MFEHVELPVSDVEAGADFYRCVLAPLGITQSSQGPYVFFGSLELVQRVPKERLHLAFTAATQEAVKAFHQAGLDAGYTDNGAPGLRSYAPGYFAAYLLDPDGHNIEAVNRP